MIPADSVPVVPPTMNLSEVWETMAGRGARVVAVKNGTQFMGLITLEDITEVFQVMGASMSGTGGPTPPTVLNTPPTSQAVAPSERASTERTQTDA
jgi:hypothetical protein